MTNVRELQTALDELVRGIRGLEAARNREPVGAGRSALALLVDGLEYELNQRTPALEEHFVVNVPDLW